MVSRTTVLVYIALVLALLAGGILLLWDGLKSPPYAEGEVPRLIDIMQKMEIHSEKLYHAVRDDDWKLAARHLEEFESTASRVFGQGIMYEKVDVSAVMEALVPHEVSNLSQALEHQDKEEFLRYYRFMIEDCNSCHTSTRQLKVVQEPPAGRRASGRRR